MISPSTSTLRDPSAIPQILNYISHRPKRINRWGKSIHGIDGPKNQSEASDGGEEGGGLLVFVLNHATTVDPELINHDQVSNAGHGVPAPLRSRLDGEGSEETGHNHDDVSNHGDEDVGTTETGQESQVE